MLNKITKNEQKIDYVKEKSLQNPVGYKFNLCMTKLLKRRKKMMLFN